MDEDDRQRLTARAHRSSAMWGPVGASTIRELIGVISRLGLESGSRILDLGCGPAESLRLMCEYTGAAGIGVDASTYALDEARRRLVASPARDRITLDHGNVHKLAANRDHDLVICLSPGWDTGGWTEFASWIQRFVKPRGLVLIADGAWRNVPSQEALAEVDLQRSDYIASGDVIPTITSAGLEPLWWRQAPRADWAEYANAYRSGLLEVAADRQDRSLARDAAERAGPGWGRFEVLHEILDLVIILARSASDDEAKRPK